MSLTNAIARKARPREKPYKLSDAHSLYLEITPCGSKLWRLKYRFNSKEKRLSFGPYPEVTLVKARELQLAARRLLIAGIDPAEQKRQAKRAAIVASTHTFEVVAQEWFSKFFKGCAKNHSSNVQQRLKNDILPWLGSHPIASIEADELLETIRRIESRGALASAHRCLRICGKVFRYASATGRAKRNPAADLRGALPPAKTTHFASITDPAQVGALLRAMDAYNGRVMGWTPLLLTASHRVPKWKCQSNH